MTNLLLAPKFNISEILMLLVSLFCKVDDFCLSFEPASEAMLIEKEGHSRGYCRLSLGEVMTITIFFHQCITGISSTSTAITCLDIITKISFILREIFVRCSYLLVTRWRKPNG